MYKPIIRRSVTDMPIPATPIEACKLVIWIRQDFRLVNTKFNYISVVKELYKEFASSPTQLSILTERFGEDGMRLYAS
jgi:hypothetical protein